MPFAPKERIFGNCPARRILIERPDYDSRIVSIFSAGDVCSTTLTRIWKPVDHNERLQILQQAILAAFEPNEYCLRWKPDAGTGSRLLRLLVGQDFVKIELDVAGSRVAVPEARRLEALAGMYVHLLEFQSENRSYLRSLDEARSKPDWEGSASYYGWLHCGGCGIPPTVGSIVVQ